MYVLKNTIFVVISITMLLTGIVAPVMAAQNYNIPSWVKNNARWWSEEKILDADFVKGIQYLIQQEIIVVPQTVADENPFNQMPRWVKTNAGWWANDKITDSDFVQAIQYLIRAGIIKISSSSSSSGASEDLIKMTMKLEGIDVVGPGNKQTISVFVTDDKGLPVGDASVDAIVHYSYGTIQKNFEGKTDSFGKFSFSWNLEQFATVGTYTASADISKDGYSSISGVFYFKVVKSGY